MRALRDLHRSVSAACFIDKLIDSVALALSSQRVPTATAATDKSCLCQAKEHYPSSVWAQTRSPLTPCKAMNTISAVSRACDGGRTWESTQKPLPPQGISTASPRTQGRPHL